MVYGQLEKNSSKKNKAVAAAQHSFKNILQEESSLYWQERLQLLLENLDQLGQRLLKTFPLRIY